MFALSPHPRGQNRNLEMLSMPWPFRLLVWVATQTVRATELIRTPNKHFKDLCQTGQGSFLIKRGVQNATNYYEKVWAEGVLDSLQRPQRTYRMQLDQAKQCCEPWWCNRRASTMLMWCWKSTVDVQFRCRRNAAFFSLNHWKYWFLAWSDFRVLDGALRTQLTLWPSSCATYWHCSK